MTTETAPPRGGVKSARRALQILELLTHLEKPATLAQIEEHLGFPRSSLHGLLHTMLDQGWLELVDGAYSLGIRTWEAGSAYLRAESLAERALPIMRRVRDELQETVQLAVLDGTENVYIAKVDGPQALTLASEVGRRLQAHATGLGKALLSGLTREEFEELYEGLELAAFTENTITDREELWTEINRAAERGFATDREEYVIGVRCVAVPVHDHTGHMVAAMSASFPTVRVDDARMESAFETLREAASELSQAMGYQPRS